MSFFCGPLTTPITPPNCCSVLNIVNTCKRLVSDKYKMNNLSTLRTLNVYFNCVYSAMMFNGLFCDRVSRLGKHVSSVMCSEWRTLSKIQEKPRGISVCHHTSDWGITSKGINSKPSLIVKYQPNLTNFQLLPLLYLSIFSF